MPVRPHANPPLSPSLLQLSYFPFLRLLYCVHRFLPVLIGHILSKSVSILPIPVFFSLFSLTCYLVFCYISGNLNTLTHVCPFCARHWNLLNHLLVYISLHASASVREDTPASQSEREIFSDIGIIISLITHRIVCFLIQNS